MAISPARLIVEWTLRRARLRGRAADPLQAHAWLLSIRIRILSFLLARYGPGAASERLIPGPRAYLRQVSPVTFCIVEAPAESPPRPRRLLAPKLREIARCNAASRRRWRFWP
jgi:hypothetical protein